MNDHGGERASPDMPEYQVFPQGSLYILAAVVLMALALVFTLICISYGLSFVLVQTKVTLVVMALVPILAVTVTTPTFFITRGRANWQRFLVVLNTIVIAVLVIGVVAPLILGDIGTAVTSFAGLALAVGARLCYRSKRYQEGLEYYRHIWAIYRQRQKL